MTLDSDALPKATSVRADVLALLREKRYEESLALLYRARSEAPGDRELQKSIDQIKEFLIGTYAKRLGGLDQVAAPLPAFVGRTPDTVMLARYIDGASTYGDIAQMCPLGQLRTLQLLVGIYSGKPAPPRIDIAQTAIDVTTPPSGLRSTEETKDEADASDARPPDTARSTYSAPPPAAPLSNRQAESEHDREYRELFARGTAAYVQNRFQDAVDAFEDCVRRRPHDRGAEVMLRRSQRDLESRG